MRLLHLRVLPSGAGVVVDSNSTTDLSGTSDMPQRDYWIG